MTLLLETLLAYILVYKYAALFVIAFVAAFLLPLPASTILLAASAFAFQGYLDFPSVIGVAILGNIIGDNLGYFISKRYGGEFLQFVGFRRILNSPNFSVLKNYTMINSRSLIFLSRFMTEVGPSVNILSGLIGIPYKKYIIYESLGEILYVLLYGSLGYYLGSKWEYSINFFTTAGFFMTSLGLLFWFIQAYIYHQNKKRNQSNYV